MKLGLGLGLNAPGGKNYGNVFVSRWNTANTSTGSTNSNQVKLPLVLGGTYNFIVDWGDGSSDTITAYNQAEITHTYVSSGIYTIKISGMVDRWQFNNGGDKEKILDILNWGPLSFGGVAAHFYGCTNLDVTALDKPTLGTTLVNSFRGCESLKGINWNNWDISSVMNMESCFLGCSIFNANIESWDLSSVTNTRYLLGNATAFNRSLEEWNISAVTDMTGMLNGVGLSQNNYDALLIGWAEQTVQSGVALGASGLTYSSAASAARSTLTGAPNNWTISGDTLA